MAKFTDRPWDGSASRWDTPEAYCAACLIDDNPSGEPKVKDRCHLPVKEPDGTYSKGAIRNALARISQVQSSGGKAAALARLHALAKQAGIGQ